MSYYKGYRWHQYFESIDDLCCPSKHRLPAHDIWNADRDLICQHKASNGRSDCGRIVMIIGPERRLRGRSALYVVEISSQELHHLNTAGLTWDEQLVYLGILTKRRAA